jgi:hypothetical protein
LNDFNTIRSFFQTIRRMGGRLKSAHDGNVGDHFR